MRHAAGCPSLSEQLAGTMFDPRWRERPTIAPVNVQADLPLDREAAYRRWRASPDGAECFAWIEARALALAATGVNRIGIKALFEDARRHFKRSADNSFTAKIAVDLVEQYPWLGALIQLRKRAE